MAIKKIFICDECQVKCDYFLSIEKAELRRATGKTCGTGKVMGYRPTEILNKVFCNFHCLMEWCGKIKSLKDKDCFELGDEKNYPRYNEKDDKDV